MPSRPKVMMLAQAICAVGFAAVFLVLIWLARGSGGRTTLVNYRCGKAVSIQARYPDHRTAWVDYQGHTHKMTIARSADGARYVGDQLEWWTKGTGPGASATLFAHRGKGPTHDALARCHQVGG